MTNYEIERPPLNEHFDLPSHDTLLCLRPGHRVNLLFRTERSSVERMWVIIISTTSDTEWLGVLDSNPLDADLAAVLTGGAHVLFHPLDVIKVVARDDLRKNREYLVDEFGIYL